MGNSITIKNTLHELASQTYLLATGLQNAAPPGSSGKSIQYLLETASQLEKASAQVEHTLADDTNASLGNPRHGL